MKILFISILLLAFGVITYAQPKANENSLVKMQMEFKSQTNTLDFSPFLEPKILIKPVIFEKQESSKSIMLNNSIDIPKVEYNTTIFCKFEHELALSTKFPLKMRLGNLDYVNYLEGK